jgi:hypothetical protein
MMKKTGGNRSGGTHDLRRYFLNSGGIRMGRPNVGGTCYDVSFTSSGGEVARSDRKRNTAFFPKPLVRDRVYAITEENRPDHPIHE